MVNPETLSISGVSVSWWWETQNRTGDTRIFSPLSPTELFHKHQRDMNMQISLFGSMDKGTSKNPRNTSIFTR